MITPCFPVFPCLFLPVTSTHIFKLSYFWVGTHTGSVFALHLVVAFQSMSSALKHCQRTDMESMNIDMPISILGALLLLSKEKTVVKPYIDTFPGCKVQLV